MSETIVSIDGPSGALFGVLHQSDNPVSPRICAVMLSCGQAPTFGPQRLYLKAARAWCTRGIDVLRVDMAGVGDSLAENSDVYIDNHSPDDAQAAVAFARRATGAHVIVVHGLCAGARVATRYAADDPQVSALLSWNCPVRTLRFGGPMSPNRRVRTMSRSRARDNLRRLADALLKLHFLSPRWWAWVARNAGAFSREMLSSVGHLFVPREPERSVFLDALARYVGSRRRALYLYGSLERIPVAEFEEDFPGQDLRKIEGGTHTFATLEAETEAIRVSADWMLDLAADHDIVPNPIAEHA